MAVIMNIVSATDGKQVKCRTSENRETKPDN